MEQQLPQQQYPTDVEGSQSSTAANAGSSVGYVTQDSTEVESSRDEGIHVEKIMAEHAEEIARKCADVETEAATSAKEMASQAAEIAIAERARNQETAATEVLSLKEAAARRHQQYKREMDDARRKAETAEAEAKAVSDAAAEHARAAAVQKQEREISAQAAAEEAAKHQAPLEAAKAGAEVKALFYSVLISKRISRASRPCSL